MFPLSLRPIDDINFYSWLGSARNRGHKVCFERRADVMSSLLVKFIKLRYCVAAVACSSEERKVPARNAGNKVLVG